MVFRMLLFSAVASIFASGTVSQAATNVFNQTVTSIFVVDVGTGTAFMYLNAKSPGVPACGAGNPSRLAINLNSGGGRAIMAAATTAFATGKLVDVVGTGNCAQWGDTEGAVYVNLHN